MKKKKLFSFKRKSSKKKVEKVSTPNKSPKKIFSKVTLRVKNLGKSYSEQIKPIKKFLLLVAGYGFIINYALYFLLQLKFNLFSLFAWGIAYYFISDEFVEWFRRLIAKR